MRRVTAEGGSPAAALRGTWARTPERFLTRPVRSALLGAALLVAVVLAALVIPAGPLAIDKAWSEVMRHTETALLEKVALVFNALGRPLGVIVVLAPVAVALAGKRRWVALAVVVAAEALTPLCAGLVKLLVDRPRPPHDVVHPVSSSFPSGHAAYAGATCVVLVLVLTTPGPGRGRWWALGAIGIVAMAWSRTYLQVHWLSDVVAGSLLGVGVALLVAAGAQRWDERRSRGDAREPGDLSPAAPP